MLTLLLRGDGVQSRERGRIYFVVKNGVEELIPGNEYIYYYTYSRWKNYFFRAGQPLVKCESAFVEESTGEGGDAKIAKHILNLFPEPTNKDVKLLSRWCVIFDACVQQAGSARRLATATADACC